MKFTRNSIIWSLIMVYLIVVSGFMSEKQAGLLINALDIKIVDANQSHFIDENDVREMLYGSKIPLLGEKNERVHLKSIEEKLRKKQLLRTAEVYITERGV